MLSIEEPKASSKTRRHISNLWKKKKKKTRMGMFVMLIWMENKSRNKCLCSVKKMDWAVCLV